MKRIFALLLAVLMVATVLCACGEQKSVKTTVDSKYVDDFAKSYADKVETDADGKTSYEFSKDNYDRFLSDFNGEVRKEAGEIIKTYGQYTFLSKDGKTFEVGIMPEGYEKATEAELKAEAENAGKAILKYQMNTENPEGKLTVVYKNCNTGEEYFRVDVTAD